MQQLPTDILILIGSYLPRYDRRALGIAHHGYERGRKRYKRIDRFRFLRSVSGYEELIGLRCPINGDMLYTACLAGCLDVVRSIRERGVPWARADADAAVISGNMELYDWMLSSGGLRNAAMYSIMERGCIEALEIREAHGLDAVPSVYEIEKAAEYGHIHMIEHLISRGVPIPWHGVLSAAVRGGYAEGYIIGREPPIRGSSHLEMVRWVLRHHQPNENALLRAIHSGNADVFDLIYSSPELEFCPTMATRAAIASGSINMVNIVHGILPDMPQLLQPQNISPPTLPIAEWFHRHGISFTQHDMIGAAVRGDLELVRYLHENGCPHDRNTIIHALESKNPIQLFMWMIENGFEFDIRDISKISGDAKPEIYKWLIERYGNQLEDLSDGE